MENGNNDKLTCKLCGANDVIKFGIQADTQMYYCKSCQRKFKDDDALYGGRVSAADISSALLEYYSGLSVNDIRRRILQEKGYEPAQSTVYQWIGKFTQKAVDYYAQFQPKVSDVWIADETVLKIKGIDVWLWDIIDDETRFVLASKLSYRRTTEDANTLFELAKQRAGKSPKVILTDKLSTYPEAVREVFGDASAHEQSNPFVKLVDGDSTRRIERWHETLKERTKVIYGLQDIESALAFLDGFFAYYNFIRPHEGLDGETPADVAGIKYDVKSWADVTHLDEYKPETYKPEYAIPLDVQMARVNTMGEPYQPGPHYGSKKGVNKAQIMAEQKRKLKAKERTRKANMLAKRRAGYEARAQLMAQAIPLIPRKRKGK
jgi:transposase-like protein